MINHVYVRDRYFIIEHYTIFMHAHKAMKKWNVQSFLLFTICIVVCEHFLNTSNSFSMHENNHKQGQYKVKKRGLKKKATLKKLTLSGFIYGDGV